MIITLLFSIYLLLAGGLHGGQMISGVNRLVRNAIFALPYLVISPLAFLTAFWGINSSHHCFWRMGTKPNDPESNWQTFIISRMGIKRDSLAWCWTGMALKGFLISIGTLHPFAVLGHMILMPLAYHIGMRTKRENVTAEFLSGALLGANLGLLVQSVHVKLIGISIF